MIIDYKYAAQLGAHYLTIIQVDFKPDEAGVYPAIPPERSEDLYLFINMCLNTQPIKSVIDTMPSDKPLIPTTQAIPDPDQVDPAAG